MLASPTWGIRFGRWENGLPKKKPRALRRGVSPNTEQTKSYFFLSSATAACAAARRATGTR